MDIPREREITEPVLLCDTSGRLNPAARGWSRTPLHTCNLKGSWPRKKKWNYWNVTAETFSFCIALANVDYLGLAFGYFLEYDTGRLLEKTIATPFGLGCSLPETCAEDVEYSGAGMPFILRQEAGGIRVRGKAPRFGGVPMSCDFFIHFPEGHETMNVVVPWNDRQFQYNSKQNSLPTEGRVTIEGKSYDFDPGTSFACQDFGRGIWPYRVQWNWSSVCGRQGGDVIAVNTGAGWTDGTGATENSLCVNGRVTKISEDVLFEYDRADYMKPWRLHTAHSDTVDLVMTPFFDKHSKTNALVLRTEVHQCFGRFRGAIRENGRTLHVENLVGWAEEHVGRW